MENYKAIDYAEFVAAKIKEDHRIGNDVLMLNERELKSVEGYEFIATHTTFIEVMAGKGSINIDGKKYEVNGHCIIGYFSGQHIIKNIEDIIQRGLMFSENFMDNLYLGAIKYHSIRSAIMNNPVFNVNSWLADALEIYVQGLRSISESESNPHKSLSAKYLTLSLFYSPLNEMFRSANPETGSARSGVITEKFLAMLEETYRMRYDIEYYAEKLNISAPYLYTSVISTTGKSPKQWMNQAILSQAKQLLEDPELTILQVSQILHFATLQGFGKFFRTQTGMSPRDFRSSFISQKAKSRN